MRIYSNSLILKALRSTGLEPKKINPYLLYYFQNYMSNKQKPDFFNDFAKTSFESFNFIEEIVKRQNLLIDQLNKTLGFEIKRFEATLIRNAVPGIGISSSFETGISLHFLYGYPYFPSSTLKGIASEYAISFEGEKESEKEYTEVFGTENNEGNVIFFDGIPVQMHDLFDVDIVTPHYQDYYSGKSYPADYLKPIPNSFLVIKKGVSFKFHLASRNKEALDNAFKWLLGALKKLGAGAKTTSGYGHFWQI
ncbi:MAG: type III-B CRISPR module RAMP protein Cmr6 [archaeon]